MLALSIVLIMGGFGVFLIPALFLFSDKAGDTLQGAGLWLVAAGLTLLNIHLIHLYAHL